MSCSTMQRTGPSEVLTRMICSCGLDHLMISLMHLPLTSWLLSGNNLGLIYINERGSLHDPESGGLSAHKEPFSRQPMTPRRLCHALHTPSSSRAMHKDKLTGGNHLRVV